MKLITGRDVTRSRFHFIRFSMPDSYRCLVNAGITEDYSMGYPDEPGFRAGIARPYYFYDLISDRQTNLKIFPFMVMDVTLYQYKNMGPDEAGQSIGRLVENVRSVDGVFVSLWHNSSLQDKPEWEGWRRVFETMLKIQKP